jgi:HAD superfamily phosphoserine phosphatase-like hydrolase
LRDFEFISVDKVLLLEQLLKCGGRLTAGLADDFRADLVDYFNQYRHVTEFATPEERFTLCGFYPKAVVFDFDGTLTKPTDRTTWERIWIELGYTSNDCGLLAERFFRNQISHDDWCRLTLERFRARKLTQSQVRQVARREVRLSDGVPETLKSLKAAGIKLYVVSGSINTIILEVLGEERAHFESIKSNVFEYDQHGIIRNIRGTKYDFEGKGHFVESVAQKLDISTNDVLFIGNSINDVRVKRVGARTLLVNPHYTHISDKDAWDDVIPHMTDLREILKFVGLSDPTLPGVDDHEAEAPPEWSAIGSTESGQRASELELRRDVPHSKQLRRAMPDDNRQVEALTEAVCSAFDMNSLNRLVRFRVEEIVAEVDFTGSLKDVALRVVETVIRRGRLVQFVEAALASNPESPVLIEFCRTFGFSTADWGAPSD